MATITGQATDPQSPGVVGLPLTVDIQGPRAIGVMGDGGKGFSFDPPGGPPVPLRQAIGVFGTSADPFGSGVMGENTAGGNAGSFFGNVNVDGTLGASKGVFGQSTGGNGVHGESATGAGVFGLSGSGEGVHGESATPGRAGVAGIAKAAGGVGVFGQGFAGPLPALAGLFEGLVQVNGELNAASGFFGGNVQVNGNINVAKGGDIVLAGGDCAEHFDTCEGQSLEPGTVVVIDQSGALRESNEAYDRRVAGVVSGAGEFKAALLLDSRESDRDRIPVALMGKACCRVDARYAPVKVGDLLTTSPTPGCAMKASEPTKAFGAVLGKALRSLEEGQGLIPILVALQ